MFLSFFYFSWESTKTIIKPLWFIQSLPWHSANTYDIWISWLTASVWGNILILLGDGLLTYCGLETAKGDIDLDQQWLR